MQVLILDTNEHGIQRTREILNQAGYYRVLSAKSLKEAIELSEPVDLILVDDEIPTEQGTSACRFLKLSPQYQDCPIIVISNQVRPDDLLKYFSDGANDLIRKPVDVTELLGRVRSALNLKFEVDRRKAREKELMDLTTLLREVNRNLADVSTKDALTEVANRRKFDEYFDQEWKRAKRAQEAFSLALIDIDFFKNYNDHYGHQAGDKALQKIAGALTACMSRPADLFARYGGEEFAAVLPNTTATGALLVADRLRETVENMKIPHKGSSVAQHITVSIGVVTVLSFQLLPASEVISRADEALYSAKHKGRNRTESIVLEHNFHLINRKRG